MLWKSFRCACVTSRYCTFHKHPVYTCVRRQVWFDEHTWQCARRARGVVFFSHSWSSAVDSLPVNIQLSWLSLPFTIHLPLYYLRQGGYVMPGVCLSVCLSVCLQLYVKTTEQVFMNILPQMYLWTRRSWLNFGSNPGPKSGSGPESPWRRSAFLFPHWNVMRWSIITAGRRFLTFLTQPLTLAECVAQYFCHIFTSANSTWLCVRSHLSACVSVYLSVCL